MARKAMGNPKFSTALRISIRELVGLFVASAI